MLCLVACLFLAPVRNSAAQDISTVVFPTLKALYKSTNGGSWTNNAGWDTTRVPTSSELHNNWHGVYFRGGKLSRLELVNNNLVGAIPSELANLAELDTLRLYGNSLTGQIPSELGNLSKLTVLMLWGNKLSGEIPSSLGNLPKLNSILLSDNELTGRVPTSFANFGPHIVGVTLENNQLSGTLPQGMTGMAPPRHLRWQNNTGGLCAPADSKFQTWLSNIARHSGPTCVNVAFDGTIADQTYSLDQKVADLTLPKAEKGPQPYSYTLTPALPAGLTFDVSTRTLSGTPTVLQAPNDYAYSVVDGAGSTASITFSVEVRTTLDCCSVIPDQDYTQYVQIPDLVLPQATGGRLPVTYNLHLNTLPTGLTFDPSTRTISGTPTQSIPWTSFELRAEDATGTARSRQFRIRVKSAAALPFSGQISDQEYTRNTPITTLTLPEATGGTGPYTYTISGSLPHGLSFNGSARTLGGTPTVVHAASKYTFTAKDAAGRTGTLTFNITVYSAPTLSGTISNEAYTLNQAIKTLTFPSATGGTAPLTYKLLPKEPTGLTFNPTARSLSGTPTSAQAAKTYTYQVEDANGATASLTFNIAVNSSLTLGKPADQAFTQNHKITDLVLPAASGGTLPYTYTLMPAEPNGLTFDAITRTLSGTPTAVQAAKTYTYVATDANGAVASSTFDLAVNAALSLPGTISNLVYKQNHPSTAITRPAATGGTTPVTYRIYPSLPQGLSFNAATRTISGTATVVQAATTYTYEARDANGATASTTFSIEVTSALAVGAISDQFYTQNQQVTNLVLPAATAGTAPYTYTLSPGLPSGLSFNAITRTLSGTPTGVQVAKTYTYEVKDADGTTVSAAFDITVRSSLALPGSIASQNYMQNRSITPLTLPTATGGTAPYTYSLLPQEPTGLTFDKTTRMLSGTPTRIQAPITYMYRVEDADGTIRTASFTIEVKAPLALPSIANQVYTRNLQITDLALPAASGGTLPYTYTLAPATLPSGLTYDSSTRMLSGTPTVVQPATPYTYQVADRAGATTAQAFTIAVVDTSVLVLPAVQDQVYVFGEEVSFDFEAARGGVQPHSYSLSPTELPQGLSYDNTRPRISGTAQAAMAPRAYTFAVTDAAQQTVSHTFNMEVLMTLAAIEDQRYVVGQPIADLELPASGGGSDPHAYELNPELPDGLVFDAATRTLTGTPLAGIPKTLYTYTVTDVFGIEAFQSFNIEVSLALASIQDQSFIIGEPIPSTILPAAEGGKDPHIYTLTPEPPAGLAFNAATRMLSGTPQEQMSASPFRYHVSDSSGAEADRTFTIEVIAAVLQLAPVRDQHFVVGSTIVPVELPAAAGGVGPNRYRLSPNLPPGVVFDAATRKLGGTPTAESALAAYTYTVEDAAGNTSSQTFGIQVHAALALPPIEDHQFAAGLPITPVELPPATGGLGPRRYDLTPDLAQGLSFNAATRILSGTPARVTVPRAYTYTAVDSMGHTARQSFQIAVFGKLSMSSVEDQVYTAGEPAPDLILPVAMGGVEPYTYNLSPEAPAGLTFDTATRTLSGTPTSPMVQTNYKYTAKDAVGSTGSQDFGITILAQALTIAPIENQIYQVGEQITPLELPAARGGRPPYEYVLSPDPPPGLTFDAEQRVLSGMPASVLQQAKYTYEVFDQDRASVTQEFTITVGTSAALLGDRAALIALYRSTDGPNWTNATNWLNPPEEVVIFTAQQLDAWYGVTVSEGRVISVELPTNNLKGVLPGELRNLTALERLQLPSNGLHSEMPTALESLRNLRQLHLQNNQLGGIIPEALGEQTELRQLWLYGNNLSGEIPSSLGHLVNLRGLLLSDNAFTGTIPPGLGGLANLQDLWLQGNQLSGTIPPELGKLDSLHTLLLNDNQLTGTIPPVLGDLTQLRDLWLQSNDLSGAIPSELGGLDSLRGLLLNDNQLIGTIPPVLGNLPDLQWLQLHKNALEGTIPESLARLAQLQRLQLSDNGLTGNLPDSLGYLKELEYLYVHENVLSGPLPTALGNLATLKELFFDGALQELCAPMDPDFRTWLAALAAVRGPDCGASALSFKAPVLAKSFLKGEGGSLGLPAAEGGQMPYQYTLHPAPPAGLTFDAETRTLRGTPADTVSALEYTYVAVDGVGRKGKLNFSLTVLPRETTLLEVHGNYPNPFQETTNLELSLARESKVTVEIFDLLGRRVLKQDHPQMQASQRRRLPITGLRAGSGIYLYRVSAFAVQQTQVQTGRMMLIN